MESIVGLAKTMCMIIISERIQLITTIFTLQHCYKIPTSQLPSIVHYVLNNAVFWIPFVDNSTTVEIFFWYIIFANDTNCVFFFFFWLICYCSWLCRSKPSLFLLPSISRLLLSCSALYQSATLLLLFWWFVQLTLQLLTHSSFASSSTHHQSFSSCIKASNSAFLASSSIFLCCKANISSLAFTLFWATNHHDAKQTANPNQISVIMFCLVIPCIRI